MAVALFLSLAVNLLCVMMLVSLRQHQTQSDKSISSYPFWARCWNIIKSSSSQRLSNDLMSGIYQRRTSGFEVLPIQSNAIVWLGDSLVQTCEWAELTGLWNIQNRGIAGDTVDMVLRRVNQVTQSQPAQILLMVGINDLRHENCNVDRLIERYGKLLENIAQHSPYTQILVHSVLPINPVMFKNRFHKESRHINQNVAQFNQKLPELIQGPQLKLIDLRPLMTEEDGHLNRLYTVDGIHLSGAAYTVWCKHLRPFLHPGYPTFEEEREPASMGSNEPKHQH